MLAKSPVNQLTSILIIANPNRMRDGLITLLKTNPSIQIVGQVDNYLTAMNLISQHKPMLMILDANLASNQAWHVLKLAKKNWPKTYCLVLVDTCKEKETAKQIGADAVLTRGFTLATLFSKIETLLTLKH